jgi:hypothetical protein
MDAEEEKDLAWSFRQMREKHGVRLMAAGFGAAIVVAFQWIMGLFGPDPVDRLAIALWSIPVGTLVIFCVLLAGEMGTARERRLKEAADANEREQDKRQMAWIE